MGASDQEGPMITSMSSIANGEFVGGDNAEAP